jgi:pimeloyl-ACP methyl ester carboxylesterase
LVLVHGGAAHSGWWDHIAPFFSDTHRVIAPDLSGHGDSGRRASYDLATWALEILAVTEHEGSTGLPKFVGHSLGGSVIATAARDHGKQIDSILIIDTPLRELAPEARRLRNRGQQLTEYGTKEEIIARFRIVPSQATTLPYITRHIALASIKRTASGWRWKFDPAIFDGSWIPETPDEEELVEDMLAQMSCRLGYLHCEGGPVPHDMADEIRSMQQLRGPFIKLAAAGHHPMLDQPLPLVAALRTLLECWSIA